MPYTTGAIEKGKMKADSRARFVKRRIIVVRLTTSAGFVVKVKEKREEEWLNSESHRSLRYRASFRGFHWCTCFFPRRSNWRAIAGR